LKTIFGLIDLANMRRLFNTSDQTDKRRRLRRDSTYAEKALWNGLRGRRLMGLRFCRQYSVRYFVLDFYCPELQLAIEVDGASHDTPLQQSCDASRQAQIEELGITFLRFSDAEVLHASEGTLEKIAIKAEELRSKSQNKSIRDSATAVETTTTQIK
jgi:very-short-patch-repair endonuclease